MAEEANNPLHAAMALIEAGNTEDALALLEALPLSEQSSPLARYCVAICRARQGRTAEAIALLQQLAPAALPQAQELLRQLTVFRAKDAAADATLSRRPSTPCSGIPAQPRQPAAPSSKEIRPCANIPDAAIRQRTFLCVHDVYPGYYPTLQRLCREAGAKSYAEQIEIFRQDGFGALHMYPFYMPPQLWRSHLSIFSHMQLQTQWWREFGQGPCPSDPHEMLRQQVELLRPDVLYIGNPTPPLDSAFIRSLSFQPAIICGWRCASIPPTTDWSAFDIILGDALPILNVAKKHGARNAILMHPAFPRWLADWHADIQPEKAILFAGSASGGQHNQRDLYWEALAKAADADNFEFTLHAPAAAHMSAQLRARCRPQLWGAELYREMRRHRIVLNAYSNIPNVDGFNMRLLEGLGLGCFLLNEYVPGIEKHFELDREIVCFRSPQELVEKARYYLAHEEERAAIARRGQEKVLRNHALEEHIKTFSEFFLSALAQKESVLRNKAGNIPPPSTSSEPEADAARDVYDQAYLWGWHHPEHREKVYLCYKTPDYADNARRFAASPEFQEELRHLCALGKPPRREVRVLDFGCGNGIASYALAKAGYDVTAMDSSTGEIAGIRAAQKLQGLDHVEFTIRHSSGETIPFPEESFDIIWMREALHHMHDLPNFVAGIQRLLKPGGILCCLRDPTLFNEAQRAFLFSTHPFYHITHDEGCYYLREYLEAFRLGGLQLHVCLNPISSPINTYPARFEPGRTFDDAAATQVKNAIFLFSFFCVRPFTAPAGRNETLSLPPAADAPALPCAATPPDAFRPLPAEEDKTPAIAGTGLRHPAYPEVHFGCGVQITGMNAVTIGTGSCIGDNCWLNANLRDGRPRLRLGRCVLIGRGSVLNVSDDLEVADFTFTGANVLISEAYHRYADITRPYLAQGTAGKGGIVIEENCWLSFGAIICGSLRIGRGSVLGAGTVVTRDVPPFAVVVGNPARIVKLFNPETGAWEPIRDQADQTRVEEARQRRPVPEREAYRALLWKNSPIKAVDPVCAGRGVWL